MSLRKASVAGTFYPANCNEIKRYIEQFNTTLDDARWVPKSVFRARALISPHAGYVYSGFSANAAYRSIAHLKPKRIVVLGPSHRVLINGASIAKYDRYETPCGELDIDVAYSKKIEDRFDCIIFDPQAHSEHSTETQIPFVDYYFKKVPIVEIVYGKIEHKEMTQVLDFLLQDRDNLLVISTDLSHYYDQHTAKKLDNICLQAIVAMDMELLDAGCEACGMIGVKALIDAANKIDLGSSIIDYRTSADASGDTSQVVGYMSAVFYEK